MYKHLHFLVYDTKGEIVFLVSWFIKKIHISFTTMISKFYLWLCGIQYGSGLVARGIIQVNRHQGSMIKIGKNCRFNSSSLYNYRGINHRCILQTGTEAAIIRIGDNCGFSGVSIVADKEVIIGNNVTIGANCIIGDRDDHSEIYLSNPQSVRIEDNVWLGMNVTVMKGVKIGHNSIIGAGAIVTRDIEEGVIAAGIPCKVIKKLSD